MLPVILVLTVLLAAALPIGGEQTTAFVDRKARSGLFEACLKKYKVIPPCRTGGVAKCNTSLSFCKKTRYSCKNYRLRAGD